MTPPATAVQNDRKPTKKNQKSRAGDDQKREGESSASTKFLVGRCGQSPYPPLSQRSYPYQNPSSIYPLGPAPCATRPKMQYLTGPERIKRAVQEDDREGSGLKTAKDIVFRGFKGFYLL